MGVFDKSVEEKDFERFKSEISKSLKTLEEKIDSKVTDSEAEAKAAAESALEIKKNIEATDASIQENLEVILQCKNEASLELEKLTKERELLEKKSAELTDKITKVEELSDELIESKETVDTATSKIFEDVEKLKNSITESESLPNTLEEIEALLVRSTEVSEGIESLQTHSMKKKSEIDALHKKIIGSDITGEDGATEHIDGLKDELETAYDNLTEQVEELDDTLQGKIETLETNHKEELEKSRELFDGMIDESEAKVTSVKQKLTNLLPGAMAEGLSAAYEEKKNEEILSQTNLESRFSSAIGGLVLISLIPFSVNVYLLGWEDAQLLDVIKDTPSLILAILPLYFPVLWLAYSTNKKLNLSKRLIEEYTHKAVLGKTFDGLSNQIESLTENTSVRDDLRTKLLFNLLQVSSENPGKLITDYDKSDHPLMEAMEHSSKLAGSVESLSRLPGFSSLANRLAKKSERILNEEAKKVNEGFAAQEVMEEGGVDEQEEGEVK